MKIGRASGASRSYWPATVSDNNRTDKKRSRTGVAIPATTPDIATARRDYLVTPADNLRLSPWTPGTRLVIPPQSFPVLITLLDLAVITSGGDDPVCPFLFVLLRASHPLSYTIYCFRVSLQYVRVYAAVSAL